MEKFRKYNSIENSFREEFIEKIIDRGFDQGEFVVQEKVHGANLSFWCDGTQIKYARRTEFIEDGEAFYNYETVVKNYVEATNQLFSLIKAKRPELSSVTVFGELFGGTYPHRDVDRDKESVTIQKGVFYSPSNDFYAFDIMLNNEEYMGVDAVNELFEQTGFFYAKTLFRGTLSEALNYSNSFDSNISKWLDLPLLENNMCEGNVVKPVIPKFFPNGSRVIIKNKNEKWQEKKKSKKLDLEPPIVSDIGKSLCGAILSYITLNRLNNVISKIGQVELKDFGKIIGMFTKDAFEDFHKDYSSEFDELEKREQKMIKKLLGTRSGALIREFFQELENATLEDANNENA